jgi:hypothetical protein
MAGIPNLRLNPNKIIRPALTGAGVTVTPKETREAMAHTRRLHKGMGIRERTPIIIEDSRKSYPSITITVVGDRPFPITGISIEKSVNKKKSVNGKRVKKERPLVNRAASFTYF